MQLSPNIRNHTDNNCFIYSFVAASYLKNNNFEEEEGRNDSLKLTSPEFYQNMSSLQPVGEFAIPMGFKQFREPDEEDERITIFANSLMTPVYAQWLSNDNFVEMVEKVLAELSTFASSGRGCWLEKVFRVDIKFAKYTPASGSSYIDLAPHLQKCNSLPTYGTIQTTTVSFTALSQLPI